MSEPVQFPPEITLAKHEALDLVAACDDVVSLAEEAGAVEIAFIAEGMRRLLMTRLLGEAGEDGG